MLLAVAGYPQVGGGGLHVAHVLWGGLLMGVGLVLMQTIQLLLQTGDRHHVRDLRGALPRCSGAAATAQAPRPPPFGACLDAPGDLALGQLDAAHRNYALRLLDGVDETSALREAAQAVRAGLTAQQPEHHNLETFLSRIRDVLTTRLDEVLTGAAASLIGLDLVVTALITIAHPARPPRYRRCSRPP